MRIDGKVVVVTGAGSGMGRELVLELLRRRARVAAVDVNPETANSGVTLAGGGGKSIPMTRADKAARVILDGVERDRFRVLVGNDARLLDVLYRLDPRRATAFIARQMKGLLP
jgi:NAD(P)-dependent dehydrogenase (short-subunit alcohol dehydrogenase family)